MSTINEDTKRELEGKHGDQLYYLTIGGVEYAVLSPSVDKVERFTTMAADPAQRGLAAQQLFRDCVLEPKGEELRKVIALKPFHEIRLGNTIAEIGGSDDRVVVKKARS